MKGFVIISSPPSRWKFLAVLSDKSRQCEKTFRHFPAKRKLPSATRSDVKGKFSKFFTFQSLCALQNSWRPASECLLLIDYGNPFSPPPFIFDLKTFFPSRRHFNKIYFIMLIASRLFSPFSSSWKALIVVVVAEPSPLPPLSQFNSGKEAI